MVRDRARSIVVNGKPSGGVEVEVDTLRMSDKKAEVIADGVNKRLAIMDDVHKSAIAAAAGSPGGAGVVQHSQDIGQGVDLLALVEAAATDDLEGNAVGAQRVLVGEEIAPPPQQHRDIARARRARSRSASLRRPSPRAARRYPVG